MHINYITYTVHTLSGYQPNIFRSKQFLVRKTVIHIILNKTYIYNVTYCIVQYIMYVLREYIQIEPIHSPILSPIQFSTQPIIMLINGKQKQN